LGVLEEELELDEELACKAAAAAVEEEGGLLSLLLFKSLSGASSVQLLLAL
jgi:hypothetical protein